MGGGQEGQEVSEWKDGEEGRAGSDELHIGRDGEESDGVERRAGREREPAGRRRN